MFTAKGRLVGGNGSGYAGHRVLAVFDENVTLPGAPTFLRQTQSGSETAADGTFSLELPEQKQIQGSILYKALAPTGRILGQLSVESGDVASFVRIDAPAEEPPVITPGTDPFPGQQVRLKGYVIDAAGLREVANRQVVLWGKLAEPKAADPRPIASMRTDSHGYFSAPWPRDKFAEAFAIVSVGRSERVPVHLEEDRFPRTVVLVVDMTAVAEEAKGKCDCLSRVPRAPDSEDLVNSSGAYSADLGGRCVDFTVPNRALEEFSFYTVVRTTEPAIKGLELSSAEMRAMASSSTNVPAKAPPALAGGEKAADAKETEPPKFEGFHKVSEVGDMVGPHVEMIPVKSASGRMRLTARYPVDWDDTPTFYQATTIAHGHILHFKQTWNADGYSLGDLLYSLPLAPCQKKQIAVVDWSRRDQARRTEFSEEQESLAALLGRDRDINEIVDSVLKESMRGGSSSSSSGVAAGFGAGGSMGGGGYSLGAVLGVSGGSSGAKTEAWQDSSRTLGAKALQTLRDKTMQSASAARSQRTTVVKSVEQGESVRVQTEVVANHNHCHAVTMQYFEVLRHLRVSQEIVDVQECLFVPLLMKEFTRDKVLRWRTLLQSTLLDPAFAGAFDAIERLLGDAGAYPEARYADEPIEEMFGELRIRFQLARPEDANDKTKAEADWVLAPAEWASYSPYLSGIWTTDYIFYNRFRDQLQANRDRIFQEQIAPELAREIVDKLQFVYGDPRAKFGSTLSCDSTLISRYENDVSLYVSLRFNDTSAPRRANVGRIGISLEKPLPSKYSRIIVESGSIWYRTAHLETYLFKNSRIDDDLTETDAVRISCPLRAEEVRNPKREDQLLEKGLLSHLNEHFEYYHRALWWNMDPERRYMLLDGFEAPNAEGRSVASVVENRLIGIVGNCLVMPVARGHKLDPTYQQDAKKPVDLIELYAPETPIPPMRISLPTRGVFAEAVMGACNSCEEIEDNRFWKFEEHPCGDEPTPIQSPGAESRYVDPGDLSAKAFPTPMINIQNAPAAPDPTGLAAALRVLAAPGAFGNVTGLDRTQQNAIAALQTAMQGAEYFGGTAAQLAASETASRGGSRGGTAPTVGTIDKTMQTIDKAEGSGHISKDQAGSLKQQAIKEMMGAGGQPLATDLDTIGQAKSKGLITDAQASTLTNAALSRLTGGSAAESRESDLGLPEVVRSAADAGQSSVSYTRAGDTESMSIEKTDVPVGALKQPVYALGIDTNTITTLQASCLSKATISFRHWDGNTYTGLISFIARYLSPHVNPLTIAECQALGKANLKVISIYEIGANPDHMTHAHGQLDADRAFDEASKLGQPSEAPVYFTVDFPGGTHLHAIQSYFQGIVDRAKSRAKDDKVVYPVGVYGTKLVLDHLHGLGMSSGWLATFYWQVGAPAMDPGNDVRFGPGNLWQWTPGYYPTPCSIQVDYNVGLIGSEGSWLPSFP